MPFYLYRNPIVNDLIALDLLAHGVVPLGHGSPRATSIPCYFDVNRVLSEMPPDEARAMRRRFRKLWRSIAQRAADKGGRRNRVIAREVGLGKGEPSKSQKNSRKLHVLTAAAKRAEKRIGK